ncbi:MAG: hypothetical protein MHPSP_002522, partial [Paramarteilia canceri]
VKKPKNHSEKEEKHSYNKSYGDRSNHLNHSTKTADSEPNSKSELGNGNTDNDTNGDINPDDLTSHSSNSSLLSKAKGKVERISDKFKKWISNINYKNNYIPVV